MLADKGYDSDWFRTALMAQGTAACIPPRKNRKVHITTTKTSTASVIRSRTCLVGSRAGDRVATRYDRCSHLHVRHLHRRNLLLLAVINESSAYAVLHFSQDISFK